MSKCWFNLDHEWSGEKFSAREPEFYNFFYQMRIEGQHMDTYQLFVVPIINEKVQNK